MGYETRFRVGCACLVVGFVMGQVPRRMWLTKLPFCRGPAVAEGQSKRGLDIGVQVGCVQDCERTSRGPSCRFIPEPIPASGKARNETIQVSPETKVLCVVPAKQEKQTFKVLIQLSQRNSKSSPLGTRMRKRKWWSEAAREERKTIPATYKSVSRAP